MHSELVKKAEAFLFMEGGVLSLKKLQELLRVDHGKLLEILKELAASLQDRGITLVQTEHEATLALSPDTSRAVEEAYKEELEREIGDAGLEVLAILLYRGASTRAKIDYIRGVNTSSTMRTLLSRGLIDRTGNPEDAREYLYRPTPELLAHLGVPNVEDLPEYETIRKELTDFEMTARTPAEDEHAER